VKWTGGFVTPRALPRGPDRLDFKDGWAISLAQLKFT
jgi:hypothetical protein